MSHAERAITSLKMIVTKEVWYTVHYSIAAHTIIMSLGMKLINKSSLVDYHIKIKTSLDEKVVGRFRD
jgi:hypothetical protein